MYDTGTVWVDPAGTTTYVPPISNPTTGTTFPTTCTASSPEAPLYVVMGQSNAVGVGKVSQISATMTTDFQNAGWPFKLWYGGNQVSWKSGSEIQTIQGPYFGPDLGIASKLVAAGQKDFYIFKYAVGGTTLQGDWKSRGGGGLYDKTIASLASAKQAICATGKNPVVKAMFWMQGESDGANQSMALNYGSNLQRLISQSRQDFLGNAPLVIGLIDTAAGLWPYGEFVRNHQRAAASASNRIGYIETNDLPLYPTQCTLSSGAECAAHYTTSGMITLGKRFYDKYVGL
jgi:hypothetical protein